MILFREYNALSKYSENKLFHDGGPYHIETNPLICTANQWNGLYYGPPS